MRKVLSFFGIPIVAIDYVGFVDEDTEQYISNTGGQFEIVPEEEEYWEEEDRGFGFRGAT